MTFYFQQKMWFCRFLIFIFKHFNNLKVNKQQLELELICNILNKCVVDMLQTILMNCGNYKLHFIYKFTFFNTDR